MSTRNMQRWLTRQLIPKKSSVLYYLVRVITKGGKELHAQLKNDSVDKVEWDKDALGDRLRRRDAIKSQLNERNEALREAHVQLTATISELESLRRDAKNFKKMLSIARADVVPKTSLRKDSCKQLDARLVKSKVVQSQLRIREEKSIALHEHQTKNSKADAVAYAEYK